MVLSSEVHGLVKAKQSMEKKAEAIHGKTTVDAFKTATTIIQRTARKEAPADTGRLRNSIVTEVSVPNGKDLRGVVGTVVTYAPYAELGTKPHTPPFSALETWARRHGVDTFLVVKAIAENGTRARNFFKLAFEENKPEVISIIEKAIGDAIKD